MPLRTLIALALLALLAGCSKLTADNFAKIGVGMPYDEVVQIIGKPDKCDDMMGVRSCVWGDAKHSAHVSFVGGKVLLFAAENLK